jgi:hypothetical protein
MDVADWLRDLGFERYEAAVRENDVDAELLLSLTDKMDRGGRLLGKGGHFWRVGGTTRPATDGMVLPIRLLSS